MQKPPEQLALVFTPKTWKVKMMKLLLFFFAWPIFCTDLVEPFNDSQISLIEIEQTLSDVLLEIIARNENKETIPHRLNLTFGSLKAPDLSLRDYISRIRRYLEPEASIMITTLIYLDEFLSRTRISLDSKNVHRIFYISFNISLKMWSDRLFDNTYMGKLGGISLTELNALEASFLFETNFDLYVSHEKYKKYEDAIKDEIARKKRGQPSNAVNIWVNASTGG